MANYLTYPFKNMRISQSYLGRTSHYPHTTGNIRDYPIDEAGIDGGRDAFYCPCDGLVIKKIFGVGTGGTNTMWVSSTTPVDLANGKKAIVTMQITHPNDSDLRRLYVGQKFKRGDIVCYEGTDGASGNHVHLSVGLGDIAEGGWSQNSNGKWVLRTTLGTVKPEEAFYVDHKFTKIYSANGLTFKSVPSIKMKYAPGNYKVRTNLIYVRSGPGKAYTKKSFEKLTLNAQQKIVKLNKGDKADGYVKGLTFTAMDVEYNEKDKLYWGKTPSGWVCLDKCEVIK